MTTFALRALALLIALLAFLPWALWLGTGRPQEISALLLTMVGWGVSLAVGLPISAALAALRGERIDAFFERARGHLLRVSGRVYVLILVAASALICALFSKVLFAHNPHLVDTIAQLFQARIFAAGELTAPAPTELEFFGASHLVQHEGRWFSQYPPGHPGLLTLGLLLGVPWLVNPLLAAATLALVYAIGRRLLGEGSGRLAALLFLLSPFVLLMSSSYMNHVSTVFFLAAALYTALRAQGGEGGAIWPLLTGVALALAATVRPLEAAAWAVALGLWMWARLGWRRALLAGGACLISLLPLLAYNAHTTGHPLRFGYTLLWGPGHGLGFHTDPWGEPFTPIVSFANTALDFARLNVALFEWPYPSLAFVLIALALIGFDGRSRQNLVLLAGLLLAAPAAYFFYWHRDNYLGPRFLYASLVPLILLTVAGIGELDRRLGRWRPAYRLLLAAGITYSLAISLPDAAGIVSGTEPEMKQHPEVPLDSLGVREAVVFVKVGWGSRLVARMWGWGVSASEAERSYRVIDGCRIQLALDDADSLASEGMDAAEVRQRLRARLAQLRDLNLPVAKGLLPDASVRVDTSRTFPSVCYPQVRLDQAGFTVYGPLIWRNDPWLRKGVVYARSFDAPSNARLMARYPGRAAYLYAPLSPERTAPPVLRRLGREPSTAAERSAREDPALPRAGGSGAEASSGQRR